MSEFFEASKNYPIFFAKNKNDNWFASVMLGFKENKEICSKDMIPLITAHLISLSNIQKLGK